MQTSHHVEQPLAVSAFNLTGRTFRQAPKANLTLTLLWVGICFLAMLLSSLPTISLTTALLATGYVLMGLWLGLRYVIAGVVCAALLIGGYIFLRENYSLWMGAVAGGTMILCGVWMRVV